MYRKKPEQLQFFPEDRAVEEEKISKFKTLLSNYEKKIGFFIIFIISLLIAYSVGTERGRRLNLTKEEKSILVKSEEIKPVTPKVEKIRPLAPKREEIKGYIIQVATYRRTSYAEREAANLKKNGFKPFIKRSGDFVVVYVGSFQSKDEAKISLKKLKKYYSDCFIKKL